jgi:transporter family protein
MSSWLLFSFSSLLLYTLQALLMKYFSLKEGHASTSLFMCLTVFLISSVLFHSFIVLTPFILLLSFVNGVSYGLVVMLTLKSLSILEASYVYPIRRLHVFIVALLGIAILGEEITATKLAGIALSFTAIYILQGIKVPEKGRAMVFLTMLLMSLGAFVTKPASCRKEEFMIYSYFFASLTCALVCVKEKARFEGALYGAVLGFVNFLAFFSLLLALSIGDASAVYPLVGTNVVLISFLSALIFKEKITVKHVVAVLLVFLATLSFSLQ